MLVKGMTERFLQDFLHFLDLLDSMATGENFLLRGSSGSERDELFQSNGLFQSNEISQVQVHTIKTSGNK